MHLIEYNKSERGEREYLQTMDKGERGVTWGIKVWVYGCEE